MLYSTFWQKYETSHNKINYMKNNEVAKATFNQKLDELDKLANPSNIGQNLKEIVLYEKLLAIEEQISKLANKVEKK
jgi:hypothetical protein